jgi:hypothetical protein
MSVIVSDQSNPSYTGKLSQVNGFYRVESYNLSQLYTDINTIYLSTEVDIPVTFANGGNCQGVIIGLQQSQKAVQGPTDMSVQVRLQQNVASVWTDRASVTLTPLQIHRLSDAMSQLYQNDVFMVPFTGGTFPYPVDTTAGNWRFAVIQTGGTVGTWNIRVTSAATNAVYATWCDNPVSFTSGADCLIVKDPVTIDMSCYFKGVALLNDANRSVCGMVCSSATITPDTVAGLRWANPPAAAYTMTVDGIFVFSAHSGFRIGTQAQPIPLTAAATVSVVPATTGGAAYSYLQTISSGGKVNFFFWGAIPTWERTRIAGDTPVGSTTIGTVDTVDWKSGDSIFIGGQDVRGLGERTIYTVTGYDSANRLLSISPALAVNNRKNGGCLIRATGYAVNFNSSSTNSVNMGCLNLHLSGVSVRDHSFYGSSGPDDWTAYPSSIGQTYISHCCFYSDTNTQSALYGLALGLYGTTLDSCNFFNKRPFDSAFVGSGNLTMMLGSAAGPPVRVAVSNCWFSTPNWATSANAIDFGSCVLALSNCVFENYDKPFLGYSSSGQKVSQTLPRREIRNCLFFGNSSTDGAVYEANNARSLSANNTFSNNNVGLTGISDGGRSVQDTFVNNTIDIATGPDFAYAFVSPVSSNLIIANALDGSGRTLGQSSVASLNNIPNNDVIFSSFGTCFRTGPGLPDTTVHTARPNAYGLLLYPSPISFWPLEWPHYTDSRVIPTGNIQGQPLTVSAWVMMGTSAYYAGDHQNPTLNVAYDGTASGSVVAVNGTNWQQLAMTVMPQTSTPYVEAWVSAATDHTGSKRGVYVDDWAVTPTYPVDTQPLDLAAYGKPMWPPYSTTAPANFSVNPITASVSPPAATEAILYTTPANTLSAVVSSLVVCNRSNLPSAFRISISPGGGQTAIQDYLFYDTGINGNNTLAATLGLTLTPGAVVRVRAATANLAFSIWGSQVSN